MRMWLIPPQVLCTKHLLGEHVETHMFVGSMNKGISMGGYFRKGLLEVKLLHDRHDILAAEIIGRGMKHSSPLPILKNSFLFEQGKILRIKNFKDLINRCPECRKRWLDISNLRKEKRKNNA